MKKFSFYGKNDDRLTRLFKKNLYVFSVSTLLFIFVSTFTFFVYSNYSYNKQLKEINTNILLRSSYTGDTLLSQVENAVIRLSFEDKIRDYLYQNDNLYNKDEIYAELKNTKMSNSYIASVHIYNFLTGTIISDLETDVAYHKNDEIMMKKMKENPDETYVDVIAWKENYPYYIRIARFVQLGEYSGAVVANVDVEYFRKVFSTVEEDQMIKTAILTEDDRLVYSYHIYDDFLQKIPLNDMTKTMPSKFGDLKYMSEISEDYFYDLRRLYIILMLIMSGILLFVGAFFSMYYTKRSVKPLELVLNTVENYATDNEEINTSLEIQCILEDIRNTIKEKHDEGIILALRMLSLRFSQTQALEIQMNPHFLYNTLDSINWMAYMKFGRKNEVSKAIKNLSGMLKYSIDTDTNIVTFVDEIEHIKAYEKILTQDDDTVEIEYMFDNETLEFGTVKFVLQPLLENAVRHGFKKRSEKGFVRISSCVYEDYWEVVVEDNGKGLDNEKILELNRKFEETEEIEREITDYVFNMKRGEITPYSKDGVLYQKTKSGYGLSNLNKRIRLIFGNTCGVSMRKSDLGGLAVVVKQKKIL